MTGSALAIAASSFSKPSETFIRDHAKRIAPGETILLSADKLPAELINFAHLDGIDFGAAPQSEKSLQRHMKTARRFWRRYLRPVLPLNHQERVHEFLKRHRPEALMAEYGPMGVMLAESARKADVPLYVHFHGFDVSVIPKMPFWPERYRKLFHQSAGIIAPSKFTATLLAELGCAQEKLHVCACGIDPEQFSETRRKPGRLIAVGRLVPKKAPHITIEAFARIAGKFPDAHLDIVGDGPLRARCTNVIKQHGLEDRVTLHGAQNHSFVAERMREASIFLQHSVTSSYGDVEGMPVSILEAMASGLPVVATRHSGIEEAVQHKKTGLLVEEHDVEAMAEAINALLCDTVHAAEMGQSGRVRVIENYTQERSREKLRFIMGLDRRR